MGYRCPHCDSLVYSRRNVLCGVCGGRLPKELLFSTEERAAVDRQLAELDERARRERQSTQGGGADGSGGGGLDVGAAGGGWDGGSDSGC